MALLILAHTTSCLLFLQFYQFQPYLRKMFIFVLLEFLFFQIFFLELLIYGLLLFAIFPLVRKVIMLSPSEDFFQCLLVLSLVSLLCCFVYVQLLLRILLLFTLVQSFGKLKLQKRLFVCTVMLQNYYEGKIVKLYIRQRSFVERVHQKKANTETLCKIWCGPFAS